MTVPEILASLKKFAVKAVGVPFVDRGRAAAGWDCWGLVVAAYNDCFGIDLADRSEFSCTQPLAAAKAYLSEFVACFWREIPAGKEQPGDIILFRPCHCGLILERRRMLNCLQDFGTIIERYDSSIMNRTVMGIYRHAALAAD